MPGVTSQGVQCVNTQEIGWFSCAHFRESSSRSAFGMAGRKFLAGLPSAINRPPASSHSLAGVSNVELLLLPV